jgi:hypothetical protein
LEVAFDSHEYEHFMSGEDHPRNSIDNIMIAGNGGGQGGPIISASLRQSPPPASTTKAKELQLFKKAGLHQLVENIRESSRQEVLCQRTKWS